MAENRGLSFWGGVQRGLQESVPNLYKAGSIAVGYGVKGLSALNSAMYTYDPKTAGKQLTATVNRNGKDTSIKIKTPNSIKESRKGGDLKNYVPTKKVISTVSPAVVNPQVVADV